MIWQTTYVPDCPSAIMFAEGHEEGGDLSWTVEKL